MARKMTDATKFKRGRQVIHQLIANYRSDSSQSESNQKFYLAAINGLVNKFSFTDTQKDLLSKVPQNFSELNSQSFKDLAASFAIDFDAFLNKY